MAECGWKPRTADSQSSALFIAPQGRTKPEGPRKKAEDSLLSVSFPHRKKVRPNGARVRPPEDTGLSEMSLFLVTNEYKIFDHSFK